MRTVVAIVVVVLLCTPLFAGFPSTDLILPAVGRVEGIGGSQFYTTVWITNPNANAVDFDIAFLLAGQANLSPARVTDSIAPGATKVYENIAETLFGIKGILGAARIRSSANLIVASRIFNQESRGLFYAAEPRANPHPPFGHLLPAGEGQSSWPLSPRERVARNAG
jgi:hypothetical protein